MRRLGGGLLGAALLLAVVIEPATAQSASPMGEPLYFWVVGVLQDGRGADIPCSAYLTRDEAEAAAAALRANIESSPYLAQNLKEDIVVVLAPSPGQALLAAGVLPDNEVGRAIAATIADGCTIAFPLPPSPSG